MSDDDIDTWQVLEFEDGLPHPRSDLLEVWDELYRTRDHWRAFLRLWLRELADALEETGTPYGVDSSDEFLLFSAANEERASHLLRHADRCRRMLLHVLPGIAEFRAPGGQVILSFADQEDYYRYLSAYHGDEEYGGSGGFFLREGYPHLATNHFGGHGLEATIAHELTHASLAHLTLPLWIEEGLAQMFEYDMATPGHFLIDTKQGAKHREFWREEGLDTFWQGTSFSMPGEIQELSYQLAQILLRNLVADYRPQWFGSVREPQLRLMAFLRHASADDCGAAAAREHLDLTLEEIVERFLGLGNWSPP